MTLGCLDGTRVLATETPHASVATSQPKSTLVILGGFDFSHTGPDRKVIDSVLF